MERKSDRLLDSHRTPICLRIGSWASKSYLMRIPAIILMACFGAVGCKESNSRSSPDLGSDRSSSDFVDPAGLEVGGAKQHLSANAHQIGSLVRVRVIAGGLPVSDYAGALIHIDDLQESKEVYDRNRCVLALIKDRSEDQLKAARTIFRITRNLPDSTGELRSQSWVGMLKGYDPKTGLAIILYNQGVSADLDVGFHLPFRVPDFETASALCFVNSPTQELPTETREIASPENDPPSANPAEARKKETVERQLPANSESAAVSRGPNATQSVRTLPAKWIPPKTLPPIKVAMGFFARGDGSAGKLTFPDEAPETILDQSPLVTSGPAILQGFLTQGDDGSATLVPVRSIADAFRFPRLTPVSIACEETRARVTVHVKVESADSEPIPWGLEMRMKRLLPGERFVPQATSHRFDIRDGKSEGANPNRGNPGWYDFSLEFPETEINEIAYLVQLQWRAFSRDASPSLFARPFLVRLQREDGRTTVKTEGIQNLGDLARAAEPKALSFPLEAPAIRVVEIADGREVLFQLKSAPYWKRFSMEKGEWLDLPQVNLSAVELAGSESSLYVLDRTAAEVRKFDLRDLKLSGSAKLGELAETFYSIQAGCSSDRAPIHVISNKGPLSFDPETLACLSYGGVDLEYTLEGHWAGRFAASGDGVTVARTMSDKYYGYGGDLIGLRRGYFDDNGLSSLLRISVSGAYALASGRVTSCANSTGLWERLPFQDSGNDYGVSPILFPNSPVLAAWHFDQKQIPRKPPQLLFYGLFDKEPFGEVAVPELESGGEIEKREICFDPFSRRVGVLAADQMNWVVRDLSIKESLSQPVLLNWPNAYLGSGELFKFKPLLLGGNQCNGTVRGGKEVISVTAGKDEISFDFTDTSGAAVLLLNLTITGKQRDVTYSIPLHPAGASSPFICPVQWAMSKSRSDNALRFKSIAEPKDQQIGLRSSFFYSRDRIVATHGPIAGCLALVTDANRVDFLELKTNAIVKSIASSKDVKFYVGADALFEYHSGMRTLTRITVPDGKRGANLALPDNVFLQALGVGAESGQPLTLVFEHRFDEKSSSFGRMKLTTWEANRAVVTFDSQTLKENGWMQPRLWMEKSIPAASPYSVWQMLGVKEFPRRLVGSRDGSYLVLQNHFVVLNPTYAIVAPFPNMQSGPVVQGGRVTVPFSLYAGADPTGSRTGFVVADGNGRVRRNGVGDDFPGGAIVTSCGRYELSLLKHSPRDAPGFEVRAVENHRQLFHLYRMAAIPFVDSPIASQLRERISMLDDRILCIRSGGGHVLQFIEADFSRLARQVIPDGFHVISQPMPVAIEGGTYDYQIAVNNPEFVASYKLRENGSEASVSATGAFRFVAPSNISGPMAVNFDVEIMGRNELGIFHSFPVIVLPRTLPEKPPQPADKGTGKPLGGGTRRSL